MEEVWREINLDDIVAGTPSIPHRPPPPLPAVVPFDALPSSLGKKSFHEGGNRNPLNRRRERMMKNRESASRSRARKQAYVNQLQLEVARRKSENVRLRRELKTQILQARSAEQVVPTKHSLHRMSTAPF